MNVSPPSLKDPGWRIDYTNLLLGVNEGANEFGICSSNQDKAVNHDE